LRVLGTASFSLYLWQQPAHFLIQHQVVDWPHWLGLLISLGLGTLSFLFIEHPARQRLMRRHVQPAAPPPQAC
jgi:peptidoglycan/LPS O-acetylase OafA/YrhL